MGHAAALAVLVLAVGAYFAAAYGATPGQPPWYPWVLPALTAAGVLMAGWWTARERAGRTAADA